MKRNEGGANHVRNSTDLKPVRTAAELQTWWRAEMPLKGYYCYRVQVLETEGGGGETFWFTFKVDGTDKPIRVNLHAHNRYVWPERPSTAQLAAKDEFGFLLIDPDWLASELGAAVRNDPMNGGKWPISAGRLLSLLAVLEEKPGLIPEAVELLEALVAKGGAGGR